MGTGTYCTWALGDVAPSRPALRVGDVTVRSPNDWFSSGDVVGPNMGPGSREVQGVTGAKMREVLGKRMCFT